MENMDTDMDTDTIIKKTNKYLTFIKYQYYEN